MPSMKLTKNLQGIGKVGDQVEVSAERAKVWVMSHLAEYMYKKDIPKEIKKPEPETTASPKAAQSEKRTKKKRGEK